MTWLNGWVKRVKINIDNGDIDGTLSNFPILIHLSTSSGHSSDDVSFVFDELQNDANRKKIAVTTSDGLTQCYVEIEKWDDANEEAWLWVKIPSVSSSINTDLYLYYDKNKADNTTYVGDTNSTPAENVWDDNFVFVSHMRDDPDTSSIRDSTQYNNDGTKSGAGEPATTGGLIADAQDFDVDDYVSLGTPSNLDLTTKNYTIESLIYAETQTAAWPVIYIDGAWRLSFGIGVDSNTDKLEVWIDDTTAYASTSDVSFNQWSYVTLKYDGDYKFFQEGVSDGATTGDAYTIAAEKRIGDDLDANFLGNIDEIRISDIARSDAWIKASNESIKDHLLDFWNEEIIPNPMFFGANF